MPFCTSTVALKLVHLVPGEMLHRKESTSFNPYIYLGAFFITVALPPSLEFREYVWSFKDTRYYCTWCQYCSEGVSEEGQELCRLYNCNTNFIARLKIKSHEFLLFYY